MVQSSSQQGITLKDLQNKAPNFWSIWRILGLTSAGAVCAVSVCWPVDFGFERGASLWWLQIISLAWMLRLLGGSGTTQSAFSAGLLFATAWLATTFWWLFISMHTYGGMPKAIATVGVLALALVLGLLYAAVLALYWRFRNVAPAQGAILFAALWVSAELARGTWLTGFGWGAIGYAHADGPLSIWIPILGVYGVAALAAWLAASLALLARVSWIQRLACVVVLGVGGVVNGVTSTETTGKMSVALLQGNIGQDEKFNMGTGIPTALNWYAQQIQANTTDLVVAPETAIPLLPQELPAGYWESLTRRSNATNTAWMAGIPLGDYKSGYTNSVVASRANTDEIWRYDKHHLVPFGEFIPPLFKWFTRMMNIPLGDFNRGALGQPSLEWAGQKIAANICYEDLFGEELAVRFTDTSKAPTIFVNVSNLAWFGNSTAIDQHLQIARMRALEFQRPFLRATNTGATVIIDHLGRVTDAIPRFTPGVLRGIVEGRQGITPYAWWVSRMGLWPLWCLSMLVVCSVWWRTRIHTDAQ